MRMIRRTKLFLKQRVENHCRRAGVLHPFNVVELFRQRRRRRNKRRPQFKSKISSGQFHENASNVDLRVVVIGEIIVAAASQRCTAIAFCCAVIAQAF